MKSPEYLQQQFTKEWQKESYRLERLLGKGFPCQLNIGLPTASHISQQIISVREHLNAWHEIEKKGIGKVLWEEKKYKQIASSILLPKIWQLNHLKDWLNVVNDDEIKYEISYYIDLLQHPYVKKQLNASLNEQQYCIQQLTVLIKAKTEVVKHEIQIIIHLLILTQILFKNCLKGIPLRSVYLSDLALHKLSKEQYDILMDLELDSKFFERYQILLTKLLDIFYHGEVNQLGLSRFLGAEHDNAHWLRLYEGEYPTKWLITQHMRIRDCDLNPELIPFEFILIIENEQCVHLLPNLNNVCVILGAGRNLKWLDNPLWSTKHLFYWGDLDSWGMAMLAQVQNYQPHTIALMMDYETLNIHQDKIITEPVSYHGEPKGLTTVQYDLFCYLKQNSLRLEQEFVQRTWIKSVIYSAFRQKGLALS